MIDWIYHAHPLFSACVATGCGVSSFYQVILKKPIAAAILGFLCVINGLFAAAFLQ